MRAEILAELVLLPVQPGDLIPADLAREAAARGAPCGAMTARRALEAREARGELASMWRRIGHGHRLHVWVVVEEKARRHG